MKLPDAILATLKALPQRRRVESIGLDLGADMLHMLQLEPGHEKVRVRAAFSAAYPGARESVLASPKHLKALVRAGLRSEPFRGRRVVAAMPAADLKLMVFNYEVPAQASEPALILKLVEERTGVSPELMVVDYLSIRTSGSVRGERSALVAVARRAAVIRHLELLRRSGLEIDSLEIAPVAVRRLVSWCGQATENVLVIHSGEKCSDLSVLWGRRLILYREVEFGEKRVLEDLSKSLEISPEEAASMLKQYGVDPDGASPEASEDPAAAFEISQTLVEILKPGLYFLAEQVEKALIYTSSMTHGASVDRVVLLGSAASWPGIEQLLSQLFSMPVSVLDPLQMFDGVPQQLRERGPRARVALAAGLALRSVCSDG